VVRQPSRLYGHNLADLIALSATALLAGVEGLEKFEAATALLRQNPDAVDFASKTTVLVKACGASPNRSGSLPSVESENPTRESATYDVKLLRLSGHRRHFGEFGQGRVHVIPGLSAGRKDVQGRLVQARVIEAPGGDHREVRHRAALAE